MAASQQEAELSARLDRLEDERDAILERAHAQAVSDLEILRDQVRELQRTLNRLRSEPERKIELAEVTEKLEDLEHTQTEKKRRRYRQTHLPKKARGPLETGQKVFIKKLGIEGLITAIDGKQFEVQAGALRLRLEEHEISRRSELQEVSLSPKSKPKTEKPSRTSLPTVNPPPMELDLRGKRVEDALDELDTYLEKCFSSGSPFSRIIHGKGTGALRETVRDALRRSSYITRWERGGENEGGDGVSVAFFH